MVSEFTLGWLTLPGGGRGVYTPGGEKGGEVTLPGGLKWREKGKAVHVNVHDM